jgi:cobalamin biosynthesis protein CbiD
MICLYSYLPRWKEIKMEQKIKRRGLLAGLGVAAAAIVAAKVTASPQKSTNDVVAASEPEGDGYRLTEHVKKYYRTTTI